MVKIPKRVFILKSFFKPLLCSVFTFSFKMQIISNTFSIGSSKTFSVANSAPSLLLVEDSLV